MNTQPAPAARIEIAAAEASGFAAAAREIDPRAGAMAAAHAAAAWAAFPDEF